MTALQLRCPSCGRDLTVSDSARGERVTCPRCLAEVSVPSAEGVRAERVERRAAGPSCPRCGRDVEPLWLTCPWCEEPLRGRRDGGYGRPDLDVRRDRQGTGLALILLAVIGAIGVLLIGAQSVAALGQGDFQSMAALVVGLLFLAGLTTIIVFVRSGGRPGAAGVRRVVVGTLAMAGGLILTVSCAVMALFAFLFAVCAPALSGAHH